ncbi:hypothetical protein J4711_13565 [Staphylococcus epidermidis]|nr:hypothetical protein [Staphylococcus epidermidis]
MWLQAWMPGVYFGRRDRARTRTSALSPSVKGKLPFTTVEETYELEYGSATRATHRAVKPGDRVLLIDDLIATGGTMMAGKITGSWSH